ncbi:MAG: ABC transporter permease [Pseudomonadota bacterium]
MAESLPTKERRSRLGLLSANRVVLAFAWTILGCIIFLGLFGNWLTPYGDTEQNLLDRLAPPALLGYDSAYLLGSDRLGRDILARLVFATRISLAIALAGTIIGAIIGTLLGFLAAYFRGLIEEAIMTLVDIQASLPFIIIALTLLAFVGNSLTLFIIIMGIYGWERYARLARGAVLSAQSQPYARAVRALGASPWRLYTRHLLPNIAGVLIVQFTLNYPEIVLLETALSFLGLGIQPPLTSLGQMMGDGRDLLINAWWLSVIPGTLIFATTLSISIIGDWLRDRLDPTIGRGE